MKSCSHRKIKLCFLYVIIILTTRQIRARSDDDNTHWMLNRSVLLSSANSAGPSTFGKCKPPSPPIIKSFDLPAPF